MLYRFGKKLIFIFTLAIILSGCVTGRLSSYKVNPLDIIPEGFSVYLKTKKSAEAIPVIREKLEELSSQMGVPKNFKERTENIAALFLNDNWGYIVAQGRYPNSLIKDRLGKSDEWQEDSYRRVKYYFSDSTKTIIILLRNIIIVSDYPDDFQMEPGSANLRAEKIIDMIMSDETLIYPQVANSVFHITSKTPDAVFAQFVTENVNFDTISEVTFDIILDSKNKKSGGVNISFLAEDENKAVLFNSVIRLFISDYVVKNKITDVRTLRENNSIFRSKDSVYVNILDIPLEKLNTFIADFIISDLSG